MCQLFKQATFLFCQVCRCQSAHLLKQTLNCRKAKYECCVCGKSNGLRVVTNKQEQAV